MTFADLERGIEKRQPKMMNIILKLIGGPDKLIKLFVQKVIGPILANSGSGWKTVLGMILYLLGYIVTNRPEFEIVPYLNTLIMSLEPYAIYVQDAGIITMLAGVGKKLVDYVPKK